MTKADPMPETPEQIIQKLQVAILNANRAYEFTRKMYSSKQYDGASYPGDMFESWLEGALEDAGFNLTAEWYNENVKSKSPKDPPCELPVLTPAPELADGLAEALKFYANAWVKGSYGSADGDPSRNLKKDKGQKAREALTAHQRSKI